MQRLKNSFSIFQENQTIHRFKSFENEAIHHHHSLEHLQIVYNTGSQTITHWVTLESLSQNIIDPTIKFNSVFFNNYFGHDSLASVTL